MGGEVKGRGSRRVKWTRMTLVEKMNLFLQSAFKAGTWETGGDGGLVSICKSDTWTKTTPGVVARTLSEIELALRE